MLDYQLKSVGLGDEFVTSIDHYDEFYVIILFDRSICRPMCKHMVYELQLKLIPALETSHFSLLS